MTHGRIPSYRFIIPPAVYDPFLPENKGFCNQETPRYFDSDVQPRQFPTANQNFLTKKKEWIDSN